MYLCAYSYPCALSIIVVKVMVKVTQQRIMGNRVKVTTEVKVN